MLRREASGAPEMLALLKGFAEVVVVVGLMILNGWWLLRRVKETASPAVQSLFGKDQWWRRG
jgi:hypothetical protein